MNLSVVDIWERLKRVSFFKIKTYDQCGKGSVVSTSSNTSLIFEESGEWENGIQFTSRLRWTIDDSKQKISLEHLRFGENRAVFLFDLVPDVRGLSSFTPHLCNQDCYQGELTFKDDSLVFEWQVVGPHKNYKIEVVYN